jgi:hypothetical protein
MFLIRHESTPQSRNNKRQRLGLAKNDLLATANALEVERPMANPSHPYHELRNAIERTSEVTKQ